MFVLPPNDRPHVTGLITTPLRALLCLVIAFTMVSAFVPAVAQAQQGEKVSPSRVTSLSIVDGTTISVAGTPKLFVNGPNTVAVRGRVTAGTTRVWVRLEDFWSSNEWHPARACPRGPYVACPNGQMRDGQRFSRASLGAAAGGERPFTFQTNIPDGLYRITVVAKRGPGTRTAVKHWFKVNRGASRLLSGPSVVVTRPSQAQAVSVRNGRGNIAFRVVTSAATVKVEWELRRDGNGRYFNDATRRFQDQRVANSRLFDGWQLVDLGRTFFNWDAPLNPGSYTLTVKPADGRDRNGPEITRRFTVS